MDSRSSDGNVAVKWFWLMSRIFRLRSFRKRWPSRLSSLFSWSRLSFEIFIEIEPQMTPAVELTGCTDCQDPAANRLEENLSYFSTSPRRWDESVRGKNLCVESTIDSMTDLWERQSSANDLTLEPNQSWIQTHMWLMSFGIDCDAGILFKFSWKQLICFKTGVHLKQLCD